LRQSALDIFHYYAIRYYAIRINVNDPIILILASLAAGEKHGYAVMEDVAAFANVRLGPGTLYSAITRMEERGLISPVKSTDRRQPYRITPAGRRQLSQAVTTMERLKSLAFRELRLAFSYALRFLQPDFRTMAAVYAVCYLPRASHGYRRCLNLH
jgi:DNA-binding PadR family transcriptional regulator